jgi:hypothetical protein
VSGNYIEIVYSSGSLSSSYSGLSVTWEIPKDDLWMSTEKMLILSGIGLSVFISCTWFMWVLNRCDKAWRNKVFPITSNREITYQDIPNLSFMNGSEDYINSYLPVYKYTKALQEVGDPTCPICFEE